MPYLTTLSVAKINYTYSFRDRWMNMQRWLHNGDGSTEVFGEEPFQMPLFPSQIPHGLVWNWTRVSAARDRQLTIWSARQSKWLFKSKAYSKNYPSYLPATWIQFTFWAQSHTKVLGNVNSLNTWYMVVKVVTIFWQRLNFENKVLKSMFESK